MNPQIGDRTRTRPWAGGIQAVMAIAWATALAALPARAEDPPPLRLSVAAEDAVDISTAQPAGGNETRPEERTSAVSPRIGQKANPLRGNNEAAGHDDRLRVGRFQAGDQGERKTSKDRREGDNHAADSRPLIGPIGATTLKFRMPDSQQVPSPEPVVAASLQQPAGKASQENPDAQNIRLVQAQAPQPDPFADDPLQAPPAVPAPGANLETIGPFEMIGAAGELSVTRRRSRLLRSQHNIYRTAVVDPGVCDVVQFTPREVSIIGKGVGATHITFWFADGKHEPVTYLVRVTPDPEVESEREKQYEILEEIVAELFPDSKVRLLPMADKLIVQGQAKDAEEAAQILALIRGEAIFGGQSNNALFGALVSGPAANLLSQEAAGNVVPASNVINMLRIPGVQQVALRVKIAELNRSAAREFGVDLDLNISTGAGDGSILIQSLLNAGATSIIGNLDNDRINFGIRYLQQRGVIRVLSEPTLVTMSGRSASFLAGGEFAVPTVVGVGGASAVTTDFRSFGVILNFLPVVIDKDRIRLNISPEFSQIDGDLASSEGTPGLSTRSVTTTVEMREGQTLAIAGLLEDTMESDSVGNLPILWRIFGSRSVTREETELIILVSPELVHPMDPEEVPPLPGFDVTEPSDADFYLRGHIEGQPTHGHRSTVWPSLKRRYRAGGTSMISGPFGHGQ